MTASERQTEKQKLILKKRRGMEITSLKKVLGAYQFSIGYHVSTEAHLHQWFLTHTPQNTGSLG